MYINQARLSLQSEERVFGPFHQQKRKDHVSGAGFSLPLFMIYSHKRITEILKEGAYPGTYKFQLQ